MPEQDWESKYDEEFKCIQSDCDGHGYIPYQNSEGEWEADQCEFHARYLLPIKAFIHSTLDKQRKEIRERLGKQKEDALKYPAQYASGLEKETKGFNKGYDEAFLSALSIIDSFDK